MRYIDRVVGSSALAVIGTALVLGFFGAAPASAAVGPDVTTTYVGPVTVATAIRPPAITLVAVEAYNSGASFNWLTSPEGQSGGGVAVWSPYWVHGIGVGYDGQPILVSSAR